MAQKQKKVCGSFLHAVVGSNPILRTWQCIDGLKQAPWNFGESITFGFFVLAGAREKVKSLSDILHVRRQVD